MPWFLYLWYNASSFTNIDLYLGAVGSLLSSNAQNHTTAMLYIMETSQELLQMRDTRNDKCPLWITRRGTCLSAIPLPWVTSVELFTVF